jgi:hypothetical protein
MRIRQIIAATGIAVAAVAAIPVVASAQPLGNTHTQAAVTAHDDYVYGAHDQATAWGNHDQASFDGAHDQAYFGAHDQLIAGTHDAVPVAATGTPGSDALPAVLVGLLAATVIGTAGAVRIRRTSLTASGA